MNVVKQWEWSMKKTYMRDGKGRWDMGRGDGTWGGEMGHGEG